MDPKKILSKEIAHKVMGNISEETVSETVDQFFRHGNTFLLLELVRLRSEVKSLREELQHRRNETASPLPELIVP
jgi:hypothetical protein